MQPQKDQNLRKKELVRDINLTIDSYYLFGCYSIYESLHRINNIHDSHPVTMACKKTINIHNSFEIF